MIREARPDDAEALARLERRAWMRLWGEEAEPERLASLAERAARRDELLVAPERTVVFDQDGDVAGFVAFGPGRDRDLGGHVGELTALYVDPVAQGAGVGGALLEVAQQRLAVSFAEAVLWVLGANDHARHVYERRGWELEPHAVRRELWAPEVRYRRAL